MRNLSALLRAITPVVRRIWLRCWRNWQWVIPAHLRSRHEFNSLEPRRLLDGSGFSYQYFPSTTPGVSADASGTVSDINHQFPSNPITSNQTPFHVIYSGTFSLGSAGTYYFLLPAAEGAILTIDGKTVIYAPSIQGDANLDGNVDINDLDIVFSHYLDTGATWTDGDFTGDGTVDINDEDWVFSNLFDTAAPVSIDNYGDDNPYGLTTLGVSLSMGPHDLQLDYYQFNDDENSLDQYPSAELLWSNSASGTYYDLSELSVSPFPPPTDLSATFEGSSFELQWSGDSSASYYNIYESSTPDVAAISADSLVSDITATSYGVATPSVGSNEYFLVTEVNSDDEESPASNEVGIGYNNVSVVQTQNTPITIDPSPGAYVGSSPSISSISGGADGSVSAAGVGEGKVIYTPSTSFSGSDSFSYLVSGAGAVPTEYGVDISISIEGYGNPNVQSVGSGGSYQGQRVYNLNDGFSVYNELDTLFDQSTSGNFEFNTVYSTTMVNTGDTYAGTDTLTTIVGVTLSVSASESDGEAWSYYERATLSTDVSTTHPGTVDGAIANSLTADTYTYAAHGDTTSYQYSLSGHETYNDTGTADAGGTDTTWTATGTYTGNFSRSYESAGSSYTNSATESGNDSMSTGAYADSTEINSISVDTFSYVPTFSLQENTYSEATSITSSTGITLSDYGEFTGESWGSQTYGYANTTTSELTFSAGSWHSAGHVNSYDFSYQNATATAAGDFTYDVAGGSVVGPGTYSFSDYSTSQDDRSYSWYDASTATTSWDSQTDGNVTSDSWHGGGSHAEGLISGATLTGTITLGGYVVSGTDQSISASLEAGTLVTVASESDDYGSGSYGGSYSGTGSIPVLTFALGTMMATDYEAGSLANSYETSQHYDFGTLDGGTATSSESYGYSQSVNGSANYTHTPEGVTVTGAQFYTGTYSGNDLSTSDGSADGSGDWVTTDINEPSYSEFASLSYSGAGNYTTSFGNVTAASGVYYEGGSTMSSIHEYSTMTDADGTSSTTGSGGESYSAVDTYGYDAEGLAAGSIATTGEGTAPLIQTTIFYDIYVESGNEGHTEETTVSLAADPDGTWRSAYAGSSTLATAEGDASYNYNDTLSTSYNGVAGQAMDSGTVYQSFEYGFNNNYSLHISADGTSTGGGFGSGAGGGFGTAAESKTTSSDNGYTFESSATDSYLYASNWSQYYDVSGNVEAASFSATNDQMGDYSSSVSSSLDPVGNGTYSSSYDTIVSAAGFYSAPYCSYTGIQPSKQQMTLGQNDGYDSSVDIAAGINMPAEYQLDYDMLSDLTFVLDA